MTGPAVTDGVEQFCRGLWPRLVGTLAYLCGDRLLAEELAQETLVRVWLHWKTVGEMMAPEAWTFRVALNLNASSFRRHQAERRAHKRLAAGAATIEDPVDVPAIVAVHAAVRSLPPRQRSAVVLRYFGQLSVAETAEAMGCSEGTVKSHTFKAIARLRESGLSDVDEVTHHEPAD